MTKMNVLLFGAGDAGERVYQTIASRYNVIGFVDNDPRKHGTVFCGKMVIPPKRIAESECDLIIISNVHGDAVRKQLVYECNFPEAKIRDYYNGDMNDDRTASLKMAAREIYEMGVNGNVAELGVYKGEFARCINEIFPDRLLYLFDTFTGFDAVDVETDMHYRLSSSQKGDFCYGDVADILTRMPFANNCIVKKGTFPISAVGVEDHFAFVSLDVDLYRPTLEGLRYFYPRMTEGGYIFVHDYNNQRFKGVKRAVREFGSNRKIRYFPLHDISGSLAIVK